MPLRAFIAAALLAHSAAALGAEPTVVVKDPARQQVGDDAALVTSETLAYRAHRDLRQRIPIPENDAIGGPAMVGLSTVSASRIRRGQAPEEVLERLKDWDGWGAAIVRVLPGSPAETAWLEPGDVVVRLSGIWVDRDDTLTWLASRCEPFRETELWYWREGQVYRTWIRPGVRDVVQASGDGRDVPLEGLVLQLGRNGLVAPRLVDETDVDYPSTARRLSAGGAGTYRLVIDPDGNVAEVAVRSSAGREDLDAAALEALFARTYEPGRFRGRRVAVRLELTVTFWPDGPPEIEDGAAADGAG